MSDCIPNSDQQTNPAQGLVRSSSVISSSSFDSCSDLLGSLEHAEESLDDPVKCADTEFQENESKCGVEDDVICDQALQSGDVPAGIVLKQTTTEQVLSPLMPLEVKDDSVKMEGLSMKDHVYGLSNAISFSKMRSLAENTVERISQLQTTFRLPTSYVFPLKNVVPVPPPDAETDVQTEASNPGEEQPVGGKDTLREALCSNLNTEGTTALTDTSSSLQKEIGNVVHMPCGSLNNKSSLSMGSDDMHTEEGFSSLEKVGMTEWTSTSEENADPLSEKLSARSSMPVVDTSKDLLGNNCMPAADFMPVIGTNDVFRKDVVGNCSTCANDSLPVMSNDDVCAKDTVDNTRMIAIDSTPIIGTNDESNIDVFGITDTISGNPLGTNCVPTKDAFSMLMDDSAPATETSYATTIDAFSRLTGEIKLVTSGNDTPTTAPHASSKSEQLVTLRQTSKHYDLDVAAPEITPQHASGLDIVHQDALCLPDYIKQVSGEDPDLLQLENSIVSFDLHKKNPAICHPLWNLSSGSGRPDLEEVDDLGIALGNKQSFGWNPASTKFGMLANGHPFELIDSAPNSPDTLLSVESHTRVDHKADMPKGNQWPSLQDHRTYVPKGNYTPPSFGEQGLQVVNSSASNNVNEGRKVLWNDRPILTEALEELQSGQRQFFFSEDQSCGEILREDRWKGLSVRLERSSNEREEKEDLGPDELFRYVENLELNETYVDTVLDMEDVLLDYDENGSRERFLLASNNSVIGTPRSSRDGSLSSSTSGLQLLTSGDCTPFTVDWIEVVGAKQRKGGSSFGERIVGVKDHTVYCIKVSSGNQEWEVLRRYRDFVDLYHQLRRKFNFRMERSLPSPWKEVDRDSRKVFGSTHPNVIEIRSTRIEKCLQSLLQAGPPLSTNSPLYWFLSPQSTSKIFSGREGNHVLASPASQKGVDVQLGTIESPCLQSPRSEVGSLKSELDHDKSSLALGKTVKLNIKIHPNKNLKQLLSAQHHSCAGCYKHLEVERGLVQGFVQTLGWGKPRLCEYSGQLYCASCHLNETAVLPAQVLWHWDFTPRRVSQLAKAYLDSIYEQPMLCVSAVNPYLYSRVPILSHVKETRRKLSRMLSCMLCPSRTRIFQTMASRRYLLENNDFFALRDLEDLSKGAFAVLPGLLTAVMESLRLHITKQCSVCSETGDWCGAGILCEEPFSPIFPFQEENISCCKICHASFHKACFSRYPSCPACPKDESKRLGLAGEFEHTQMEEHSGDHRDVPPLLDCQDVTATLPSVGETDLQGQFVSDKQSHNYSNWPSFYGLLPKKRLW